MKYKFLFTLLFVSNLIFAQTATNFTCKDCAGVEHNLFSELEAGKVIVLCWVMPCGTCLGPSLTTYNVVQSYQSQYPGKVIMYAVDDYANTSCTSLNSWVNGNNMTNTTKFSNTAIKMMDYGSNGMPKVVVLAGAEHKVYYNANNTVNSTNLQTAINLAISETTGINDNISNPIKANIYPNPISSTANLNVNFEENTSVEIYITNQLGQKLNTIFKGNVIKGDNKFEINTNELNKGLYYINIKHNNETSVLKMMVLH